MSDFKQTWWDKNLDKKLPEFESWIGDKNATSKAFFRGYVEGMKAKSLIDFGCGTATEYFAYKEEYPEMVYLGIDSSQYLYDRNTALGVPMMLIGKDEVPLPDNHSEIVFSRHVLEHQPDFRPILSEMIRLASNEAIHVFFIIPGDTEQINYDPEQNLYHNRFSRHDIENFLNEREDVEYFIWTFIIGGEIGLIIKKKGQV